MLSETVSQTAGPYLHIGMMPSAGGIDIPWGKGWNILAKPRAQGQRIRLEGVIFDGTGTLVRDAQVEIWQANAHGRYDHPDDRQAKPLDEAFHGFGRAVADFKTGVWWFDTVKPGPVEGRHGTVMAPHINVAIFARALPSITHWASSSRSVASASAAGHAVGSPSKWTVTAARHHPCSTTPGTSSSWRAFGSQ